MRKCCDCFVLVLCILLLLMTTNHLAGYGKRWGFNDAWRPVSLVAADGQHYADGSNIDFVHRHQIDDGDRQVVEMTWYTLGFGPIGLVLFVMLAKELMHPTPSDFQAQEAE